jgi:hypothetical protein
MSREDSFALSASDQAASLNRAQMLLDDHDRNVTMRVRPFDVTLSALGRLGLAR